MEHFDSQLAAGAALLRGAVAEMPTGEGKTLAATLCAAFRALSGTPVHVITANDYLAERDAEAMRLVYELLGLTVGVVTSGRDAAARRRAYACDVTYCCNKEVVFDYLRDRRLKRGRTGLHLQFDRLCGSRSPTRALLMRGLHAAIVDEADSVLIDETRTPLVLSQQGRGADQTGLMRSALELAAKLRPGRDYTLDRLAGRAELTAAGGERLRTIAHELGGTWSRARWSEEIVSRALAAREIYRRDEHYLVRDGRVLVIDEHTGRAMPGRSWAAGLHQLIEAKEGVAVTREAETLARISYQRFFRRYLHLAGMTGTAAEAAAELWSVYGLRVVVIAPHAASARRMLGERVVATLDEKWRAVVERAAELRATGRPVLIGTASVAASEHLSRLLAEAGLAHATLNARQDRHEAAIIARAGERGRITVATNMAGRGTDIKLGPGVAELGGLHVIVTERHEASRIDRQLCGRAARQGDPGSCELILSLEDPLLERVAARFGARTLRRVAAWTTQFGSGAAAALLRAAQRRTERAHAAARTHLLRADHRVDDRLAFSGQAE
jgi:preprotein translocase subunit SecA